MTDEYREVLSRLDILEHDVADVRDRITDLHRTMDERFDRMNSEMDERFGRSCRWTSWSYWPRGWDWRRWLLLRLR